MENNPDKIKRSGNLKNIQINPLLNKINNNNNNNQININNFNNNTDEIITKEKNFIDDFEIADIKEEEPEEFNFNSISKSDIILNHVNIDLWEVIPISTPSKKAKKDYMKSLMSTIVYNGIMFKDKLSESTNKNVIIYDSLMNNFNIIF